MNKFTVPGIKLNISVRHKMINVYVRTKNFDKEIFLQKFSFLGEFNFNPIGNELFPLIIVSSNNWENVKVQNIKSSFFSG